jgi:hypothetical protein
MTSRKVLKHQTQVNSRQYKMYSMTKTPSGGKAAGMYLPAKLFNRAGWILL